MKHLSIKPQLPPGASVGLLAGSGRFPIAFAEAAKKQGYHVFCVGLLGSAPDELGDICDAFTTLPVGRVGKAIRTFKRGGIKQVVMAGKVEKTFLFQPLRWIRNAPDWRAIHMLWKYASRDRKDDTLLLGIIREFRRDGIRFESALNYCPELLVDHGFLTKRRPTSSQWKDVRFGWELAKEMGRLDVGQSVAVSDRAVLAIEAVEGTDACIRRAGGLCRRGGFTVVKVAKPQQDMRFDVPTIGMQTIQSMREAGGRVLAIESEKTIVLDREDVLRLADRLGIAIVALNADEIELRLAS